MPSDPKARVRAAMEETVKRLDILLFRGDLCTDPQDEQTSRQWLKRVRAALRDLEKLSGEQFGSHPESKPDARPLEEAGLLTGSNAASPGQECPVCGGRGELDHPGAGDTESEDATVPCHGCGGSGCREALQRIVEFVDLEVDKDVAFGFPGEMRAARESLSSPCPLEAEVERLRQKIEAMTEEHLAMVENLASALCPNSPPESAQAEFLLDAMGACQIITRLRVEASEATRLRADLKAALDRLERYEVTKIREWVQAKGTCHPKERL